MLMSLGKKLKKVFFKKKSRTTTRSRILGLWSRLVVRQLVMSTFFWPTNNERDDNWKGLDIEASGVCHSLPIHGGVRGVTGNANTCGEGAVTNYWSSPARRSRRSFPTCSWVVLGCSTVPAESACSSCGSSRVATRPRSKLRCTRAKDDEQKKKTKLYLELARWNACPEQAGVGAQTGGPLGRRTGCGWSQSQHDSQCCRSVGKVYKALH